MGYAIDGGFAEYALGYARHVVRVPDGIAPADASPLTCAGVTTYKAVKVSGARLVEPGGRLRRRRPRPPGRPVRADHRRLGVAVDINPARLESARAVGAEHVVNAARGGSGRGDPAPRRRRRRDRDRGHAVRSSRPSARWRAAASSSASASRRRTTWRSRSSRPCSAGSTIHGSIVGTRHDLEEVFELHRRGLTTRRIRGAQPRRRQHAIEQVLDGSAPPPRLVFRMQPRRASPLRRRPGRRRCRHAVMQARLETRRWARQCRDRTARRGGKGAQPVR